MSATTSSRPTFRNLPRGFGLIVALAVLVVAASLISPHFLNPINILNVLRQVALYGILGVGMTFILLTAGIDLSISSIVGFVGVVAATLMGMGYPILIACHSAFLLSSPFIGGEHMKFLPSGLLYTSLVNSRYCGHVSTKILCPSSFALIVASRPSLSAICTR